MRARYVLAPEAALDLVRIWRYIKKESTVEMVEEHLDEGPHYEGIHLPSIPLGTVIAERRILFEDANGHEREVIVRLGLPVPVPSVLGVPFCSYRCPTQIIGLGIDEKIIAPPGMDAFEAIYNALDVIGQQVDYRAEQLQLTNPSRGTDSRTLNWIWKYPQ